MLLLTARRRNTDCAQIGQCTSRSVFTTVSKLLTVAASLKSATRSVHFAHDRRRVVCHGHDRLRNALCCDCGGLEVNVIVTCNTTHDKSVYGRTHRTLSLTAFFFQVTPDLAGSAKQNFWWLMVHFFAGWMPFLLTKPTASKHWWEMKALRPAWENHRLTHPFFSHQMTSESSLTAPLHELSEPVCSHWKTHYSHSQKHFSCTVPFKSQDLRHARMQLGPFLQHRSNCLQILFLTSPQVTPQVGTKTRSMYFLIHGPTTTSSLFGWQHHHHCQTNAENVFISAFNLA